MSLPLPFHFPISLLTHYSYQYVGWGKTRHPGRMTNILQQAKMPVVSKEVCHKKNYWSIGIPVSTIRWLFMLPSHFLHFRCLKGLVHQENR